MSTMTTMPTEATTRTLTLYVQIDPTTEGVTAGPARNFFQPLISIVF